MSTTLTRHVADAPGPVAGTRLAPGGRRRRPALAVGSLTLIVACVAVFVSVYAKAGNQVPVLALARTVAQGQTLNASDLTVVRISTSPGIATVPVAEASIVLGRRAAQRLEPGTLLTTSELVSSYAPPAGESVVGVAVKEGQLPASGVARGETVNVVLTGPPGALDSATVGSGPTGNPPGANTATSGGQPIATGTVLVADATVLESGPSPTSSGSGVIDVSLLTASTLAPLVASASAAGQVALIIVAPGP